VSKVKEFSRGFLFMQSSADSYDRSMFRGIWQRELEKGEQGNVSDGVANPVRQKNPEPKFPLEGRAVKFFVSA